MQVAIFEAGEWERQACRRLAPADEVRCAFDALDAGSAAAHDGAEAVSTFVNSRPDAGVLARFPKLKQTATRSTGYNHIDMGFCEAHGVTVPNVPGHGDATVAEHAFALLLAVARNLVDAVERTRRADFSRGRLRGFDLRDKVLGVIGTGRIGRRVIGIARGFGMDVVAHDLHPDAAAADRLGFRCHDLDRVLGWRTW